jgi:hypothetical protein
MRVVVDALGWRVLVMYRDLGTPLRTDYLKHKCGCQVASDGPCIRKYITTSFFVNVSTEAHDYPLMAKVLVMGTTST